MKNLFFHSLPGREVACLAPESRPRSSWSSAAVDMRVVIAQVKCRNCSAYLPPSFSQLLWNSCSFLSGAARLASRCMCRPSWAQLPGCPVDPSLRVTLYASLSVVSAGKLPAFASDYFKRITT